MTPEERKSADNGLRDGRAERAKEEGRGAYPDAMNEVACVFLYPTLPRITSSSPVTVPPGLQVMAAVVLRHAPFPLLLFLTYTLSGSCNHFLTLIMHEVAHNLAFKRLFANRVFSIIVNLPLGIPAAMWVWEGGPEGGVQAPTSG